jgi:hypothetical protein
MAVAASQPQLVYTRAKRGVESVIIDGRIVVKKRNMRHHR